MENYRPLYRISVAHDYFDGQPCTAIGCRLSPQGAELARQRRMLFRQTAYGEWTVLYDTASAGPDTASDVLQLELSIAHPAFPLYTEWKDFRPSAAHVLELPREEESIDAASAIRPDEDGKRTPGAPFCTVRLRLTEQLVDAAKADRPLRALLHFRAPSVQWEYLFLPHGEDSASLGGDRPALEDAAGKAEFSAMEQCEAYGRTAWRTVSQERIPLRTSYGCRLRLVAYVGGGGSTRQKRILLPRISPPVPGGYESGQAGVIRQVCYY